MEIGAGYGEITGYLCEKCKRVVAIEKYEKATDYITEDFYLMTDILDTLAACYIKNEQCYEGIKTFVKLLEILSDANAEDYETKFQLCNNLSYILEPSSKNSELNNMLNKEIEGKIELETYVHNFFIKVKEK